MKGFMIFFNVITMIVSALNGWWIVACFAGLLLLIWILQK